MTISIPHKLRNASNFEYALNAPPHRPRQRLRETARRIEAMAALPTTTEKRVLLAAPRGYCAGVDRAVVTVEKALELYGPPVYVRKEIVHNKHVVDTLRARGAIFVDELSEVPPESLVVFSAHGISPAVHAE